LDNLYDELYVHDRNSDIINNKNMSFTKEVTMDCLFCKIIQGEIPSVKIYEDDLIYAFEDIDPVAPVHIILVPKKHIQSINALDSSDKELVGHMHLVAFKIAKEKNIAESGYRMVTNIGEHGGQSVMHLHYHILGGRELKWPPG